MATFCKKQFYDNGWNDSISFFQDQDFFDRVKPSQ